METRARERQNIVILGAGFGGITALFALYRALRRRGLLGRYPLILINRTSYHLYTPALYEIAAIPHGEVSTLHLKSAVAIPIEDVIGSRPIRFIGEEVRALDHAKRRIALSGGEELPFAYAVIALGAETNFFGIPGLREHTHSLKTFEDAVRLRNRVETLVAETSGPLSILIGGAGATGVELAAEFVNFVHHVKTHSATGGKCREEIVLLEAGPEILPGFNPAVVKRARRRLEALGVVIRANTPVARVTETEAVLRDDTRLPYHLFVWAGGVKPSEAVANFGLALDAKGRIAVNEFLEARLPARPTGGTDPYVGQADEQVAPGIFAVGDCVGFTHPKTGTAIGGNVPATEAEARLAAENIIADIDGTARRPFRPLVRYPFILAVGGKRALTDLLVVRFSGFLGWILKQLVELHYLLLILSWPKALRMWLRAVWYSTRND